jgi:hypothetical protein
MGPRHSHRELLEQPTAQHGRQIDVPAGRGERPAVASGWRGDVSVATLDVQGRLSIGQAARVIGWPPGQLLSLMVRDEAVVLAAERPGGWARVAGLGLPVDGRWRVQIPFGVRHLLGLGPGSRLVVVAVPDRGAVVVFPVARVVTALLEASS